LRILSEPAALDGGDRGYGVSRDEATLEKEGIV